jgi:hypothetical protein
MCTVTYIPIEKGFVLTSNRDEKISRGALEFVQKDISRNKKTILFPQDTLAKGSWIAFTDNQLVCLLNGGFEKHKHNPPYAKSRGIMLLERFNYDEFSEFIKETDFENIEPCTIVSVEHDDRGVLLQEFVWNGKEKHLSTMDELDTFIWSSCTLYTSEIQNKRERIFKVSTPKTADDIIDFHQQYGEELGVENQFKMKREQLETISTTQYIADNSQVKVRHYDYVNNEVLHFENQT